MNNVQHEVLIKAYQDLGKNLGIFCYSIYTGAVEAGLDKSVALPLTTSALAAMIKTLFDASQQTNENKENAMTTLLKSVTGGKPQ